MNRTTVGTTRDPASVPRTRGDEPDVLAKIRYIEECSPHTRG